MRRHIPKQHRVFRWLIVVAICVVLLVSVVVGVESLISSVTDG